MARTSFVENSLVVLQEGLAACSESFGAWAVEDTKAKVSTASDHSPLRSCTPSPQLSDSETH